MATLKKYWLVLICAILVAAKVALSCALPLCIHAGAIYDDAWAVNLANSLAQGDWLGEYDDGTLMKNIGYPLFLTLVSKIPGNLLLWTAVLYAAAAVFMSWALRPLFKHDWTWLILCALILFCPISLATDTFQRVYRNSVTAAQVLLIFGAYLGCYLRIKGTVAGCGAVGASACVAPRMRATVPWMLVGAIGLAWFWISREDSIWVLPFVAVATIVLIIVLVLRFRRCRRFAIPMGVGCLAVSLVFLLLPFGATFGSVQAIKAKNYQEYGLATTSEINSGNFARFIKDLYAIQPDEMPENLHVACPWSSVEMAFELSPTFAGIKAQVKERFFSWGDVVDNDPGDGQVNGGEFFWVIRLAGSRAGIYSSASNAEEFWGQCADELEEAFAADKVETRAVMPSSIMSPWRSEYASLLLPAAVGIYAQACDYGDVTAVPFIEQGEAQNVENFESLAGAEGFSLTEATESLGTIGDHDELQTELVASEGTWPLPNKVCQIIVKAYQVLGSALGVLGLIAALVLVVLWARQRRAARKAGARHIWGTELGPTALVLVSVFLGVLCLIAGLAYSRVSSFTPISYYYYGSAAYPLLLAFNATAIIVLLEAVLAKRRKHVPAHLAEKGEGQQ